MPSLVTPARLLALATGLIAGLALGPAGPAAAESTYRADRSDRARPAVHVFRDARRDVAQRDLDITRVRVVNTPEELRVRVRFPGRPDAYDFPTGNISVFLDTDRARRGPEYGHFMEFWSDYRFAETQGWRERPTPEWGHSPDGACVADAGLTSDPGSRLRWFELIVRKTAGCYDEGAVRVAVSTLNTGDLEPWVEYDEPYRDWLGGRRHWTPWIAERA